MRSLLAALLLVAGCAPSPAPSQTVDGRAGPSGLTAEEEALLDGAAELLGEDGEVSAPLSEEELRIYPDARGMPADVQRFIIRWQDCQHRLGEPAWDEARRRQIESSVAAVCPGIDLYARDLRRLHARNVEVIERLRNYGPLGQ